MDEMEDKGIVRCEEVQELMGHVSWRAPKVGILALFFVVVATFVVASFVDYPKIVRVDMSLSNAREVMAVCAISSGRMLDMRKTEFANKGDTLAVIKTTKGVNSYLLAPTNGRLFFCGTQQVGDYIEKGECMFALANAMEPQIVGHATIVKDLRKRIAKGMRAECSIDGNVLEGQVSGIAQCANPTNGLYSIVATFRKPKQTYEELVWNENVSVKIVSSKRSLLKEILLR